MCSQEEEYIAMKEEDQDSSWLQLLSYVLLPYEKKRQEKKWLAIVEAKRQEQDNIENRKKILEDEKRKTEEKIEKARRRDENRKRRLEVHNANILRLRAQFKDADDVPLSSLASL